MDNLSIISGGPTGSIVMPYETSGPKGFDVGDEGLGHIEWTTDLMCDTLNGRLD